jgi:hypothetical protein
MYGFDWLEIGIELHFLYPEKNSKFLPRSLKRRRLLVMDVRDTIERNLDPVTLTRNPQRRRGRLLLTGIDLELDRERSFYLDEMVMGVASPIVRQFRLGVFNPTEPDDSIEYVGPVFSGSIDDKAVMRLTIEHFNRRAKRLCMAAFPWDRAG